MPKGIIFKIVSGNFYVDDGSTCFVCKASAKLRDNHIYPLVGDIANFEVTGDNSGYIKSIEKRRNKLVRPPVSNIDQVLIVTSLKDPDFSSFLLDKLLVNILDAEMEPVIYFSKVDKVKDMSQYEKYINYYKSIGIDCYIGNSLALENKEVITKIFANKSTILTGQSGAGKSSLLNALDPSLELLTDDISYSLGRGKHTTREVELRHLFSGLIADTPGFSSLTLDIDKERLSQIFPGFTNFNKCKFRGCKHDKEIGCAIKNDVETGKILKESYDNYLRLLNELGKEGNK